jgi:hypothetical protein
MPASLSEAFGENFEIVPNLNDLNNSNNSNRGIQKKKKDKKRDKEKFNNHNSNYHLSDRNQPLEYGQNIPRDNFTNPDKPRQINYEIQPYTQPTLGDQQFEALTNVNDFGPSNYSIKPQGENEYYDPYNTDPNMDDAPEDIKTIVPKPTSFSDNNNSNNSSDTQSLALDPRMVEFSKKLDLILEKLGHLDEPAQENIHDIILFVIFGVFVIFIMDSVYRVGKVSF